MLSIAVSSSTFATRSIISPGIWRSSRRELEVEKAAVSLYELAVGVELAASAQIADQIPVHARVVPAAGLLVGAPDRQVHRTAELLVKQDVLGRPRNAVVGPDPQLSEITRPLVRIEHGVQVLL